MTDFVSPTQSKKDVSVILGDFQTHLAEGAHVFKAPSELVLPLNSSTTSTAARQQARQSTGAPSETARNEATQMRDETTQTTDPADAALVLARIPRSDLEALVLAHLADGTPIGLDELEELSLIDPEADANSKAGGKTSSAGGDAAKEQGPALGQQGADAVEPVEAVHHRVGDESAMNSYEDHVDPRA